VVHGVVAVSTVLHVVAVATVIGAETTMLIIFEVVEIVGVVVEVVAVAVAIGVGVVVVDAIIVLSIVHINWRGRRQPPILRPWVGWHSNDHGIVHQIQRVQVKCVWTVGVAAVVHAIVVVVVVVVVVHAIVVVVVSLWLARV